MDTDKTYRENLKEIVEIVNEEFMSTYCDLDVDEYHELVHEVVDSALIYSAAQFYVMKNTDNEDAYFEVTGEETLEVDSYDKIVGVLAYYALTEDLNEYLPSHDEIERMENIREYLKVREARKVA